MKKETSAGLLGHNEPTIHDKYRKWIIQVDNGYATGLHWDGLMEIIRWCESRLNRQIAINPNCNTCIIDLLKLFKKLE